MQKQAAKTRVFTQETLTELQDKMHKYAEQPRKPIIPRKNRGSELE